MRGEWAGKRAIELDRMGDVASKHGHLCWEREPGHITIRSEVANYSCRVL